MTISMVGYGAGLLLIGFLVVITFYPVKKKPVEEVYEEGSLNKTEPDLAMLSLSQQIERELYSGTQDGLPGNDVESCPECDSIAKESVEHDRVAEAVLHSFRKEVAKAKKENKKKKPKKKTRKKKGKKS